MAGFTRTTNGFNFVYENTLAANEEIILAMPAVSANKRGINDIGWICDGNVTISATMSRNYKNTKLWQEINDYDEINKTVSAVKIKNNSDKPCDFVMRVILN